MVDTLDEEELGLYNEIRIGNYVLNSDEETKRKYYCISTAEQKLCGIWGKS